MSAFNYTAMRARADRLIKRAGMAAKIRRLTARTGGEEWNPASQSGGVPKDYDCTVVIADYTNTERAGTLIEETDRRAIISAQGLCVCPAVGDKLVVCGKEHPIKALSPVSPAGTVVLYDARIGA